MQSNCKLHKASETVWFVEFNWMCYKNFVYKAIDFSIKYDFKMLLKNGEEITEKGKRFYYINK